MGQPGTLPDVAEEDLLGIFAERGGDDLARGELVAVLEEFSTPFPGLYLYYPQRRHVSPALRALIEHLRSYSAEVIASSDGGCTADAACQAEWEGGARLPPPRA